MDADADGEDLALEAGSDDELTRRINAEAKDLNGTNTKDDEWTVDVSEEAVKARAQELPDDFKQKLNFDDDEDAEGEGNGSSSYDQLGSWVISTAESKGGVKNVEDVEIYLKAKDLGIETKHKTLTVLAQTVFDADIVAQVPIRASMLKKVGTSSLYLLPNALMGIQMITSEKHERAFLGGTERFVGKENPKLIAQIPKILLAYYQHDLISEAVLKNWGSKKSHKYVDLSISKKVRKAAEPFLEWLENAESGSEEESEEE